MGACVSQQAPKLNKNSFTGKREANFYETKGGERLCKILPPSANAEIEGLNQTFAKDAANKYNNVAEF